MEEEDMNEGAISEEDREQLLAELAKNGVIPQTEIKHNAHTFLNDVRTSPDTTKTANLKETTAYNEIGHPTSSVRTCLDIALFAKMVMKNPYIEEYYRASAEIVNATSLSRDAKLIGLAVMQKRVIEDATRRPMAQNKGWFKRKQPEEE